MKTLKEGFFGNIGIGKTGMIENWLKEMDIKNYTINSDYTIDVNGGVNLARKNITELPEYIQFGTVKGNFNISGNPITTLRGCPKEVNSFGCWDCNKLITLEDSPKIVNDVFDCSFCKNLTSLEGAPQEVKGNFYCNDCKNLTSLEGAPKKVGRGFYCNDCKKLTSLEGAPQKVGKSFYCNDCNNLTSLEGAPKEVGGGFNCKFCGNKFNEDEVKKYSNVNGNIKV